MLKVGLQLNIISTRFGTTFHIIEIERELVIYF